MIFKLKLQGLSAYQIASQLSSQNVITPKYYSYVKNICKHKKSEKPRFWDENTVIGILENVAYTGSVVMGKTRTIDGKQHKVDKKD